MSVKQHDAVTHDAWKKYDVCPALETIYVMDLNCGKSNYLSFTFSHAVFFYD